MSTPSKRRSRRRRPQDSLRPGWMLNSILFCALLASIGGCYVWLGAKYRDREVRIAKDLREIKDIEARIGEKNLLISRCLAEEPLRARIARAGLELKPIDFSPRGRLVRLPDPVVAGASLSASPVLAGNRLP